MLPVVIFASMRTRWCYRIGLWSNFSEEPPYGSGYTKKPAGVGPCRIQISHGRWIVWS